MQASLRSAEYSGARPGGLPVPAPSVLAARADPLDVLEPFGLTVPVGRSRRIHGHGQPAEFCWRVLSGCARTVQLMEDGRRQIGEFLWPGDLLGLDDRETYDSDAEAVTDLSLRRYPRQLVEAEANSNLDFALQLRTLTLAHLRSANRQMLLLGRKTAVEKIASFLLEMHRQSGSPTGNFVNLPMSRTDIADHLGLSIETVCRNLVSLQRDGTVAIQRTGIELCDRATLIEIACDPLL